MNLQLLELFLRVAELGSINRAAQTLSISQPALSRQIAMLEQQMGVPLFLRTQAGVQLTEAGQLLNERARPLLRQFELLKDQVSEKAVGQFTLGTPPAWHALVTGPFIASFARRHPAIKLRIQEGLSHLLNDAMAAGLLDMAVVPFRPIAMGGYTQLPLVREPVVVMGLPADGLESRKPLALAALADRPLVLPGRPNALRLQLEHALERKGIRFEVVVEADALPICLDLARRGVGLCPMPASALFGGASLQAVSWAPLKGQHVTWALAQNTARSHSAAVQHGQEELLGILGQILAEKQWPGAELLFAQDSQLAKLR